MESGGLYTGLAGGRVDQFKDRFKLYSVRGFTSSDPKGQSCEDDLMHSV